MRTVLIVDDADDHRSLLCSILEDHGYAVIDAAYGREALAILEHLPGDEMPEAVVFEAILPDYRGIDLCRRLRCIPKLDGVPLLMLSAWIDRQLCDEAHREGVADIFHKPLADDRIAQRVETLIAYRSRGRDLSDATSEGLPSAVAKSAADLAAELTAAEASAG